MTLRRVLGADRPPAKLPTEIDTFKKKTYTFSPPKLNRKSN